jgi:hypothetical protein
MAFSLLQGRDCSVNRVKFEVLLSAEKRRKLATAA